MIQLHQTFPSPTFLLKVRSVTIRLVASASPKHYSLDSDVVYDVEMLDEFIPGISGCRVFDWTTVRRAGLLQLPR
jgi:hypothetical protein